MLKLISVDPDLILQLLLHYVLNLGLLHIKVAQEEVSPCLLVLLLLLPGEGLGLLRKFNLFLALIAPIELFSCLVHLSVLCNDLAKLSFVVLLDFEVGHTLDLWVHCH